LTIRLARRRAVAPIIATLLMVAIAVVGGILIFVFAQGFFTDTQIQGPAIDSIEIFGFDARDSGNIGNPDCGADTSLATHLGTGACATGATGAVSGNLKGSDAFTLFIRNTGAGDVVIDTIRVRGEAYTAVITGAVAAGTPLPANLKFCVLVVITSSTAGACTSNIIRSGEERTVIVNYEAANEGPVKIGRPLLVKVVTGNGATFTINIMNGVVRGVG